MPRTGAVVSPALSIELDFDRGFWAGEIISGRVVRSVQAVSPRAWVTLRLFGRTKVKVSVERRSNNNRHTDVYRSRFDLLGSGPELGQALFDGVLHIPPGGSEAWQFALTLPVRPNAAAVLLGEVEQEYSFLALNPNVIASGGLPFSFAYSQYRFDTFVEYVLEAQLVEQHGAKAKTTATATRTVFMLPPPVPALLHPALHRAAVSHHTVHTQRLLPGMADAELSFMERTRKLFHTSSVPKLNLRVEVEAPEALQLSSSGTSGRPAPPMSFRLRVVAGREQSSPGLPLPGDGKRAGDDPDPDELKISVVGLRLRITAWTEAAVRGPSSYHRTKSPVVRDVRISWPEGGGLGVPCGDDVAPLDVGRAGALLFEARSSYWRGADMTPRGGDEEVMYPDFVTYNIKHWHSMRWDVELVVAKETVKIRGEGPLVVVAPPPA
ncbi:hypothetical protein B0T26DRAFT_805107 [Lasiosphaeria miniovina]|uniref:Arrestin-like N-terminal domain-containing protein n=1 Tax=Lasiosphaeria miniovina TaxID=1954250 RepID=A0AA40A4Y5_9PEZI|nr:uncharacterized protein B0T26DRAFT_805107 [Lasiosphaeria miniovina]KAK0709379.1 hypothetical protein B0T26DRAFT_805107 [Lasiosphaeria miniovina]